MLKKLPRPTRAVKANTQNDSKSHGIVACTTPRRMDSGRQSTILVVDDHAEIADSVREILEEQGYRVQVARDGEEALQVFPTLHKPCLVLLDMRLPKVPGKELARRFRDACATSAIVALTGASEIPTGITEVLRKPFDIDDLLAIARRYCGAPSQPAG